MKQTPMLMRSQITGDRYIVTKYKIFNKENGDYEALEKFIFTEELIRHGLIKDDNAINNLVTFSPVRA